MRKIAVFIEFMRLKFAETVLIWLPLVIVAIMIFGPYWFAILVDNIILVISPSDFGSGLTGTDGTILSIWGTGIAELIFLAMAAIIVYGIICGITWMVRKKGIRLFTNWLKSNWEEAEHNVAIRRHK